jgi:hypothetical protein
MPWTVHLRHEKRNCCSTVAVRHRSATFQRHYNFPPLCGPDWLCAAARRPKGNRSALHMCHWKVASLVAGCDMPLQVGPPSVHQLQEKGTQQPPSGGCWLLRIISWQIYEIAQKPCIFSCIIWYMMLLQNSNLFRKFTMSDNFFYWTALRNRAVWSGAVRWPLCCLYSGSCKHPGTGWWLLRKVEVIPGVENDCTGTQVLPHDTTCVTELGPYQYETTCFRLAVPAPGCTTTAASLHPNSNMWHIFTQLIFNCTRTMC